MSFGSAAVALIILIDLATGQGPPGLTNYVGLMPPPQPLPEFRRPLQVRPLPVQYLPSGSGPVDVDYAESKQKFDKELEKESSKESSKESGSKGFAKFFEKSKDEGEKNKQDHQNKGYAGQEYGAQKSYGSQELKKGPGFYGGPPAPLGASNYGPPGMMYPNYEKEKKGFKSTPAPGMLASLSQSMSKAWNSWG